MTSQTQLAALLAESGIEVTQATLSRDLEELGAVKLRGSDGAPASYVLPPENAPLRPAQAAPARLTRLLADLLTNAEGSANLAVLRTPPGRRAVPRLRPGQGRPPRRPGHDRGRRHSARRLPGSRRRTGPRRPPARSRRAHPRDLPRTEDRPGRECTVTERVVLAYSGGLDTSVAIGWIAEETGAEVIAVAGDVGQGGEDMEVIRQRALDCGAVESIVADMRDEYADEFCLPALQANALYMDRYPLVSALSRPLIVKHLVAAAKYHGASMVAHGCTGKGNDQVRFEVGIGALGPDLQVLAPVRDSGMTRDKAIAFAEEKRPADRDDEEVAVLDRPERVGPRGGDRLPRGHLERPHRGRLRVHAGPDRRPGRPTRSPSASPPASRRRSTASTSRCCRRSSSSTPAPAPRASAGWTWSRTGWSASRAARSTRPPARSR